MGAQTIPTRLLPTYAANKGSRESDRMKEAASEVDLRRFHPPAGEGGGMDRARGTPTSTGCSLLFPPSPGRDAWAGSRINNPLRGYEACEAERQKLVAAAGAERAQLAWDGRGSSGQR
ncbi:hypothetical protein KIL84_017247 [Mauremys mutica]|uniref:Uncharacterized protein n=1 Tax=Mauremys mutica TaxID=74926 RepID=A0A9D3X5R6_9SAUR|nr:hypothetical protein KIL84_017247 [Mauremys mutica]